MPIQIIVSAVGNLQQAIQGVVPVQLIVEKPISYNKQFEIHEMGVLIGLTGSLRGRLVIHGPSETFGRLGEAIFGMVLEGDMLHSFVGEVGNMIAGNFATLMSQKGASLEITPPTVLTGETISVSGFEQAQGESIMFDGGYNMSFLLLMEE